MPKRRPRPTTTDAATAVANPPQAEYTAVLTADNFDQFLATLARRNPFRPFTVEVHGGRRFEVDFANALVFRDGAAVFMAPGGVPILFDHESVTAILGDTAEASA